MFSGAIRITGLNDYIAPSQACVVALNGTKLQITGDEEPGEVLMQPPSKRKAQGDSKQLHWTQAQAAAPGQAIKVTLHDCLACSGCVTSAETVLLESQSAQELLDKLRQAREARSAQADDSAAAPQGPVIVVSISPQSIAALAALYAMSPKETFARLSSWLVQQGAAAVLDVREGRDLALVETAAEFIDRYRSSHQCSTSDQGQTQRQPSTANHTAPRALPMLASACPGWVCYAEKTHGDFVLPYISSTKSPQAVMGSLVKRLLASHLGCGAQPARLYHATVMPCYDKKLEAAREELSLEGGIPEVDCCLTSSEVHKMLEEAGITHLGQVPAGADSRSNGMEQEHGQREQGPTSLATLLLQEGPQVQAAAGDAGSGAASMSMDVDEVSVLPVVGAAAELGFQGRGGSGGYLEYVFRSAAKELFGMQFPPGPLPLKVLRNTDFQELVLDAPAGSAAPGPLLRCAQAYGFRNIQSLMRKVKAGKSEYDFIEVMACPSGCLNGGGQIKAQPGETAAQLLERVEQAYTHQDLCDRPEPQLSPVVQQLYQAVQVQAGRISVKELLHTSYRQRERTVGGLASDW